MKIPSFLLIFCARFNIENIGLWDFSGLLQVESHVTIHFSFIGIE